MNSMTFFLSFIPVLALILLGLNLVFAPHSPYQEKSSTFECGFHSFLGQNRTQFSISFFVFALLFLIFDLELVQIYPIALTFYTNEGYGLSVMLLFFLVLTLGFAFELGKKALNIESRQYNKTKILKSGLHNWISKFKCILPYMGTIISVIIVVVLLNWDNVYIDRHNMILPSIYLIIFKLSTDFARHYAKDISIFASIYVALLVIRIKILCWIIWGYNVSLFNDVVILDYFKSINIPQECINLLNNNLIILIAVCSILHNVLPYKAVWGLMVYLYRISCKMALPYCITPLKMTLTPLFGVFAGVKISLVGFQGLYTPKPRDAPISKVLNSRLPAKLGDGFVIDTNNYQHMVTHTRETDRVFNKFNDQYMVQATNGETIIIHKDARDTLLNVIRTYINGNSILINRDHLAPAVAILDFRIENGLNLEKRDIEVTLHLVEVTREILRKVDIKDTKLKHFPFDTWPSDS